MKCGRPLAICRRFSRSAGAPMDRKRQPALSWANRWKTGRGEPRNERHNGDEATVRSDGRGPRQYRRAWACQRDGARPEQGDRLLPDGAGADARSLPDGRAGEHVGECRPRPVPSADPQPRPGGARHHRACGAGPGGAAEAAGLCQEIPGRHRVQLPRGGRHGGDDVPVGQPHPRARAGSGKVRPASSWHAVCRVRRAGRHRSASDGALLSGDSWRHRRGVEG